MECHIDVDSSADQMLNMQLQKKIGDVKLSFVRHDHADSPESLPRLQTRQILKTEFSVTSGTVGDARGGDAFLSASFATNRQRPSRQRNL
jgi:hypothetical protein